jgi:hypothetical protein
VHVAIFASELCQVGGVAASRPDVEVGGTIIGHPTHAGRLVAHLALPSGPQATHDPARFIDDPDYVSNVARDLQDGYGIQLIGTHHTHPGSGPACPSHTDVDQVRSVCNRNRIPRWLQIISTRQPNDRGARQHAHRHSPLDAAPNPHERPPFSIQVSSFFYPDAPRGEYVRCALTVIPGISPIREALVARRALSPHALTTYPFPIDYITYDAVEIEPPADPIVLRYLEQQCAGLPRSTSRAITFEVLRGDIHMTVRLPGDRTARIVYAAVTRPCIRAVHLTGGRDPQSHDVTTPILRGADLRPLLDICRDLGSLAVSTADIADCPRNDPANDPPSQPRPGSADIHG